MSTPGQRLLQFAPNTEVLVGRNWLGLQLDHRQFLDALQDEWLCPSDDRPGHLLGIESFSGVQKESKQKPNSVITVSLCFDIKLLPKTKVAVCAAGKWQEIGLDSLSSNVEFVFWPGAIPLFAVTRILVNSTEERLRLLSLVQQVSNVSMPEAAIDVNHARAHSGYSIDVSKLNLSGISFNERYGLVRGAITMAVWAIPRVDPWFNLLVASLAQTLTRLKTAATAVEAPWCTELPWIPHPGELLCETLDCRLWRAALRVLLEANRDGGLDATDAVERVTKYAAFPSKSKNANVENWGKQTLAILRGEECFGLDNWKLCPIGKALQILFLRPQPEHFAKWLQDVPGMPPPVWFSAATLCGYLHGYRGLASSFRGTALQRQILAIHSLNVTSDSQESVTWPSPDAAQLTWRREEQEFVLMCGESEFSRKAIHPRSLWYAADLDDLVVGKAAEDLARGFRWNCFNRRLMMSASSIPFTSQPNSKVSLKDQKLVVEGSVHFDLPATATIGEIFDPAAFRKCLVFEGAPNIQPPPIKKCVRVDTSTSVQPIKNSRLYHSHSVIHGLLFAEDYLTLSEEADLVSQIDAADWLEELKRRVQHYGWRYDYKARQINKEMYLGTLPGWAAKLADRLARDGLLPHVPDQVIVNEYKGKQGISKHVDCKPCFEDGIVMISLLESWEMIFSRGRSGERESVLLPRRSVTVLSGEARYLWTHEIPKRATEPGGLHRERRISITFRKAILNTVAEKRRSSRR